MPPRGVKKGTKRARQYEHVKESEKKQGRSEGRAKEIAARTVQKERALGPGPFGARGEALERRLHEQDSFGDARGEERQLELIGGGSFDGRSLRVIHAGVSEFFSNESERHKIKS